MLLCLNGGTLSLPLPLSLPLSLSLQVPLPGDLVRQIHPLLTPPSQLQLSAPSLTQLNTTQTYVFGALNRDPGQWEAVLWKHWSTDSFR